MKKRFLLALLPILCLSSCGEENYFGVYKFMLGKEGDPSSQVGISTELTNEDYSYKVFYRIAATVKDHAELDAYSKASLKDKDVIKVKADTDGLMHYYQYDLASTSYTDKQQERPYKSTQTVADAKKFNVDVSIGQSLGTLPEELAKAIYKGIAGYYKPTDYQDEKYGQRVSLGTILTEEGIKGIEDIYDYIAKETSQTVADFLRKLVEENETMITEDFVEYIIAAYLKSGQFTLKIPVSYADFQQQLAWYGKYFDLAPDVKENIHSIKDVMKNFLKIIEGLKIANLLEKKNIVIDTNTNKFVTGETITMPGKVTGQARFGTLPNSAKNEETGLSEIDYMNKYYASDFSNTMIYNNQTDKKVIGRITKWENTLNGKKETFYYFYDANSTWNVTPDTTTMDATLYVQTDFFSDYTVAKDVTIHFGQLNLFDSTLGVNVARVTEKGTDAVVNFDSFYRTPFEFRAFHTLPLTLTKK